MQTLPLVLMYGTDPHLSETRCMVLSRAGFSVKLVEDFHGFKAAFESSAPDVVILCHTLTQKECDQALEVAQSHCPGAPRLVLTAGDRGCLWPSASAAMDATDGPRKLIRAVANLTGGGGLCLQAS